MEPTDATIQILRKIQETLVGLRDDTNARFERLGSELGERLERLERHAVATNEALGVMNSRLGFFERAATAATDGRARLDDRVERLEARVDDLEERVEPKGG